MKCSEPESLPKGTPAWFRQWHDNTFWHFKYRVESKLTVQDRLLYIILGAIIIAAVTNAFF